MSYDELLKYIGLFREKAERGKLVSRAYSERYLLPQHRGGYPISPKL